MQTVESLTATYRRLSAEQRAAALRRVQKVWPGLRLDDLSGTWPGVKAALESIVDAARGTVAELAAGYVTSVADLEVGGDVDVVPAPRVAPDALAVSLEVTGPVAVRIAQRTGAAGQKALERGLIAVSGAVTRAVLNGGRDTVIGTAEANQVGWMRQPTGAKTCWFCAMQASRGPVYRSAATARADPHRGRPDRFHDHCDCLIVPVFAPRTLPASIRYLDRLWADTTGGLSGPNARAAFKAAYEAA